MSHAGPVCARGFYEYFETSLFLKVPVYLLCASLESGISDFSYYLVS